MTEVLPCGCERTETPDEDVTMRHSPKCTKVDTVLPLDAIGKAAAERRIRENNSIWFDERKVKR